MFKIRFDALDHCEISYDGNPTAGVVWREPTLQEAISFVQGMARELMIPKPHIDLQMCRVFYFEGTERVVVAHTTENMKCARDRGAWLGQHLDHEYPPPERCGNLGAHLNPYRNGGLRWNQETQRAEYREDVWCDDDGEYTLEVVYVSPGFCEN